MQDMQGVAVAQHDGLPTGFDRYRRTNTRNSCIRYLQKGFLVENNIIYGMLNLHAVHYDGLPAYKF